MNIPRAGLRTEPRYVNNAMQQMHAAAVITDAAWAHLHELLEPYSTPDGYYLTHAQINGLIQAVLVEATHVVR